MTRIICIGSSAKDIFFPILDGTALCTPEDITAKKKIAFELGAKYQVEDSFEALGGCAVNVSAGLSKLGVKSAICTRVGADETGRWIVRELKSQKVDCRLVQVDKMARTDVSAIMVHRPSEDRIIFYSRDANERTEIKLQDVKSDYFFVSSLSGNKKNSWQSKLKKIISAAGKKKIKIIFNPGQKNIKEDLSLVLDSLKKTYMLIVNKDEATELVMGLQPGTDRKELENESFLIRTLQVAGPGVVVVTDGSRGAWGSMDQSIFHVDAIKKDIIDTTGAGDAFSSGFIAAYVSGKSIEESLRWGIVSSSNVVVFYGAHAGLLNEKEIIKKAKQIKVFNS